MLLKARAKYGKPNQHPVIEIPHGLKHHVIVVDTVKSKFNLGIESTDQTSIVYNIGRTLMNKTFLMLGPKETQLTTQTSKTLVMIFS